MLKKGHIPCPGSSYVIAQGRGLCDPVSKPKVVTLKDFCEKVVRRVMEGPSDDLQGRFSARG